jgi:hypothetical protein
VAPPLIIFRPGQDELAPIKIIAALVVAFFQAFWIEFQPGGKPEIAQRDGIEDRVRAITLKFQFEIDQPFLAVAMR